MSLTWFIVHLYGNRHKLITFTNFGRGKHSNGREKVPHGPSRISISEVWRSRKVVAYLITKSINATLFYGLEKKNITQFVCVILVISLYSSYHASCNEKENKSLEMSEFSHVTRGEDMETVG